MEKVTAQPIYLDYSATAPLRPEAKLACELAEESWGNPSSIHSFGRAALNLVDEARRKIAAVLECHPDELVFTSGGTEADNLAIVGFAANFKTPGHIITSAIEHKAVLESCRWLENRGWRVDYIRPDKSGVVNAKKVLAAVRENTRLISIMYANNEIGTIQPIREIGKGLEKINAARSVPVRLHTDAVQGGNLLNLDVRHLHVDLMSLSGHKVGGPKGVGLLFVKKGVMINPLLHGGGQESGRRSGSLNVAGIVGMAAALHHAQRNREKEWLRLIRLQQQILTEVAKHPSLTLNGGVANRLPNNINFSCKNKSSDELVIAFDLRGIAVSAASACSSGSIEPSYVIEALGSPPQRARSSLRITMGYKTTSTDVKRFITSLRQTIATE